VQFAPVSSVPYWDDRCGAKFADTAAFETGWDEFWAGCAANTFDPRGFVLDNLTLEQRALQYYEIARSVARQQKVSATSGMLVDGWLTGMG
jgi:hypothetical protein